MNDKFKYAPGKPGFGSKGRDGSVGSQGLGMYFTDLDPVGGAGIINNKIANDQVLWSTSSSQLSEGRVYVTGDLFFDDEGKAYEIDAENDTFAYKFASLNVGGFFVPLNINADNGFQRYFNSNTSPKYIIDNVYTQAGAINYTESPLTIYGINPKNFARIEYSNVELNTFNPFTVYSSGTPGDSEDDKQSIAIVRDLQNRFHIGNLDDAGNLRNVGLVFDVSSLIQTKEPGNGFSTNTPIGSVLTNYEIAANSLFDPNFNRSPASFNGNMGTTDVSIRWNLLDFTNDSGVTGDLYFFETLVAAGTFRIDSSAARPLIFTNVNPSGSMRITGVSPLKQYGFFMKLNKNGWIRNSDIVGLYQGFINAYPITYNYSSFPDGSSARTNIGFDVSANFAWDVSITQNPSSFMTITSTTINGTFDGSIYVSIAENLTTSSRTGIIRVELLPHAGIFANVAIIQPRGVIPPELTLNYSTLDFDKDGNALTSYSVDVSSNASWNLTDYASWINPDITSGGPGVTTVTFTIDSNDTWEASGRDDSLTFTPTGGDPQYLLIDQEEGPYLNVNTYGPTIFSSSGTLCGASYDYSFDAYITSNVSWTPQWQYYSYKFNPTSPGGGSGDDTITVSCTGYNGDSYNYTDTLEFWVDGIMRASINVEQRWTGDDCY